MLQKAFGESILSKTRTYEPFKAFWSIDDFMEYCLLSGRSSIYSNKINITYTYKKPLLKITIPLSCAVCHVGFIMTLTN